MAIKLNKNIVIIVLACICSASLLAATGSQLNFTLGTTPGNPSAGSIRIWANTATGNIECLTSSGVGCFANNAVAQVTTAFSATPTFTCPSATAGTIVDFKLSTVLSANITSSTLTGCTPGSILNFSFTQAAASAFTVSMPTGFSQACQVSGIFNAITNMSFNWDGTNAQLISCTTNIGPSIGSEQAAPSGSPASGVEWLWLDSTGLFSRLKNSAGTIFQMAKELTAGNIRKAGGANGVDSAAAAADIYGLFTGVHDSAHCTAGDGTMQSCSGTGAGSSVTSTTAITANANSTADQQMMELSLGAGYLNSAKQPFEFFGAGVYSTQALQTPTLTFKVKLCTVSGCGSGTVVTLASIVSTATLASSVNNNWSLSFLGITATTGATGNLEFHGPLTIDLGASTTTADAVFGDVNTAVSSNIDLTAALFVDFTVTFSTQPTTPFNTATQRAGGVMPSAATAAPVTSVFGQTGVVTAPAALGASTATTQAANDNSTKVATTAYVDGKTIPNTNGGTGGNSSAQTGFAKVAAGTWSYAALAASDIPAAASVFNSGTITIPSGNSILVGCTTTCSVPVPVPVAGYQICVKNNAGVATVITLSALGSSAMYPKADDSGYGTAGTGTMVSTAAAGNKVCLIGRDATHYELGAVNASANWTVN